VQIEELTEVSYDDNADERVNIQKFEKAFGMSVWFRWRSYFPVTAQCSAYNLVFRVVLSDKKYVSGSKVIPEGVRTISLWQSNDHYILDNYGSTQSYETRKRVSTKLSIENRWVFAYIGYSSTKGEANAYIRIQGERHGRVVSWKRMPRLPSTVNIANIFLGKDPLYPGFNGQIARSFAYSCFYFNKKLWTLYNHKTYGLKPEYKSPVTTTTVVRKTVVSNSITSTTSISTNSHSSSSTTTTTTTTTIVNGKKVTTTHHTNTNKNNTSSQKTSTGSKVVVVNGFSNQGRYAEYNTLTGYGEYSVSGYFQPAKGSLNNNPKGALLFRLAAQSTKCPCEGHNPYVDRMLRVAVNAEGYEVSTYRMGVEEYVVSRHKWAENVANRWVYIHVGYNYASQSVTVYLKYQSGRQTQTVIRGVEHFVTGEEIGLYVNGDRQDAGFLGKFSNWNLNMGAGVSRPNKAARRGAASVNHAIRSARSK